LNPEQLTIEILRQFEAFYAAFGRPPDFVDGHQHVHLFPQIRDAFLRVTKEAAPKAWVRQCGRPSARKRLTDHKALLLDGLSRRFRVLADKSSSADYTRLFEDFLQGMREGGVIMCHPGKADAELSRVDTLTDQREREYAFFSSGTFPRLLAAHGVSL
jgi:predicted glycoside hydrolase/deacetylase ChbG (UPF0249 family)